MWYKGHWFPICGLGFWDNDNGATTVCRKLGFSQGTKHRTDLHRNADSMPVGRCNRDEALTQCTGGHNAWGVFSYQNDACVKGKKTGITVTCETYRPSNCLAVTARVQYRKTVPSVPALNKLDKGKFFQFDKNAWTGLFGSAPDVGNEFATTQVRDGREVWRGPVVTLYESSSAGRKHFARRTPSYISDCGQFRVGDSFQPHPCIYDICPQVEVSGAGTAHVNGLYQKHFQDCRAIWNYGKMKNIVRYAVWKWGSNLIQWTWEDNCPEQCKEPLVMSGLSQNGLPYAGGVTSEIIIPRPITPTFGYRGVTSHKVGSWFHDIRRDVSWWRPVSWEGGVHTIRVVRLRGVVWVELSPGRVSVDVSPKDGVGVLLFYRWQFSARNKTWGRGVGTSGLLRRGRVSIR